MRGRGQKSEIRNQTVPQRPLSLMGEGRGEGVLKARYLRTTMTNAERKLWKLLRTPPMNNFKFRRQHPIQPYIADFACAELLLIIEVDGGQHIDNLTDIKRTEWLSQHGWHVVRFWNNEVLQNIEGVWEVLLQQIQHASRHRKQSEVAMPKAFYRPRKKNTLTRPSADLSHEGEVFKGEAL